MDPKYALRGLKPIARTGRSLLKNWSYISNPCIYFSILLDWRAHLAKTLFIPHKYIKCALFLLRSLPPKWVLQEKVVILGHESRRRQQIG